MSESLNWVAENWQALTRRYGADNMDVIIDNVDKIIERWDGQRAFEPYFHRTVKWLIWKKEHPRYHVDLIAAAGIEDSESCEVRELLEGLSDASAQVLFLKFVMGYTYEQVAAAYGVSQGTAYNYVQRAITEAQRAQANT